MLLIDCKTYIIMFCLQLFQIMQMLNLTILFSLSKTQSYMFLLQLYHQETIKNYQNFFSRGFERSVYWNEYKMKSENKNTTNEYSYFLESNFVGVNRLFAFVYLNKNKYEKRFKTRKCDLLKEIIDHDNVIINGKNVYDQAIDSDMK